VKDKNKFAGEGADEDEDDDRWEEKETRQRL
jgi:hypothetical protein